MVVDEPKHLGGGEASVNTELRGEIIELGGVYTTNLEERKAVHDDPTRWEAFDCK